MTLSTDKDFIRLAHRIALWSKDPERKVGAVLVSEDKRFICGGYNRLPEHYKESLLDNLSKVEKNKIIRHAEIEAIYRAPATIVGWTIYVTRAPCVNCVEEIIYRGIKRMVCPKPDESSSWFATMVEAQIIGLAEGLVIDNYEFRQTFNNERLL